MVKVKFFKKAQIGARMSLPKIETRHQIVKRESLRSPITNTRPTITLHVTQIMPIMQIIGTQIMQIIGT
jgi:hypothetical protein